MAITLKSPINSSSGVNKHPAKQSIILGIIVAVLVIGTLIFEVSNLHLSNFNRTFLK